MKDSNSNPNPFARSTGYRLAEWAACAAIHYSGLDRRLGPLHARPGQVGAILMYHRVHPDSTGAPWQLERRHFRQLERRRSQRWRGERRRSERGRSERR